jgi:hypothetical protein
MSVKACNSHSALNSRVLMEEIHVLDEHQAPLNHKVSTAWCSEKEDLDLRRQQQERRNREEFGQS